MNKQFPPLKAFVAPIIVFVFFGIAMAQSDTIAKANPPEQILEREHKVELFPNPASNELNVEAKNMKQIEIIDMLGRIVMKKERCNDAEKLDISSIKDGMYFIRITTADNQISIHRFIKK
jgi:hypothetical protein